MGGRGDSDSDEQDDEVLPEPFAATAKRVTLEELLSDQEWLGGVLSFDSDKMTAFMWVTEGMYSTEWR